MRVLATGVDLEQLQADRLALRLALQRLLQDLLGLGLAAIGDVDVGFGDRVDLGRARLAHRRDLRRDPGVRRRVDALAAGGTEQRVRREGVGRDEAVLEALFLAPAHREPGPAGTEQRQAADRGQHDRIARQVVDERRFLGRRLDSRGRRRHPRRRLGFGRRRRLRSSGLALGLGPCGRFLVGSGLRIGVRPGRSGLRFVRPGCLGLRCLCFGCLGFRCFGPGCFGLRRSVGPGRFLGPGGLGARRLDGSRFGLRRGFRLRGCLGLGLGLGLRGGIGLRRIGGLGRLDPGRIGLGLGEFRRFDTGGIGGLVRLGLGDRRGGRGRRGDRTRDTGAAGAHLFDLGLQVGQRLVAQFQHLLQVGDVALELGDPAVRLLQRRFMGDLALGTPRTDRTAVGTGLDAGARQLETIAGRRLRAVLDLAGDRARRRRAGGAPARLDFGRCASEALLVGAEIARRQVQRPGRRRGIDRGDPLAAGNLQRPPLAHEVRVAIDER